MNKFDMLFRFTTMKFKRHCILFVTTGVYGLLLLVEKHSSDKRLISETLHETNMLQTLRLSNEEINSTRKHCKGNWTIITSTNSAYLDFFYNWLTAYRNLSLNLRVVVIAEDKLGYKKLRKNKSKEIQIIMTEFKHIDRSVSFGSGSFNDLSVRRHIYILYYLKTGNDVIFSDVDTVWMKNPLPYFTENYDMWMQVDEPGKYCPGTMAIKSNEKTIKFYQEFIQSLRFKPQADQPFLNTALRKSKLRVKGLDPNIFPSGRQYFDMFGSKQKLDVVVVHNNWIVGHLAKLKRFEINMLWFVKNATNTVA